MLNILVVGSSSNLARVLIPLLKEHFNVILGGRSDVDVHLDLSKVSDEKFDRKFDILINLAADFGGTNYEDIFRAQNTNVLGLLSLANKCKISNIPHFVHVSSVFSQLEVSSKFYTSYSLSKRHGEELLQYFCLHNSLDYTILRPSQIYGVGNLFRRHQPLFYHLIDKVERSEEITLYGANDASKNFIHVNDVATIILFVVLKKVTGIYDVVAEENVSLTEIINVTENILKKSAIINWDTTQPDIPDNIFACNRELYQLLDYFPKVTIHDGIKMELEHRKTNR